MTCQIAPGSRVKAVQHFAARIRNPDRLATVIREAYNGRAWIIRWDGRETDEPIAKEHLELVDGGG